MTKSAFFAFLLVIVQFIGHAELRAQCANCSNSYVNATDPGIIEYDNLVSTFHSTLARKANGDVVAWGQATRRTGTNNTAGSNLSPVVVNSINYPGLTGNILKFTAGSRGNFGVQFTILTTDGLFAWGTEGELFDNALTNSTAFQQLALGLPAGVQPTDVKMLFGSTRVLGLLTCTGDVYMLSELPSMRGNGSTGSFTEWSRVTEAVGGGTVNLSNVVALRGSGSAMIALKNDGTVWTWGLQTYVGNGTAASTTNDRAVQMVVPAGVTPKLIGATNTGNANNGTNRNTSYYILGTDGFVYALGNNSARQLGDWTTTERTQWVRAQASATSGDYLANVVWISPKEHDAASYASMNVITRDKNIWAWGANHSGMLGGGTAANIDPTMNPGGLTDADQTIAVETGGHTSVVFKECSGQYGYVGHRINGSMGDGTSADAFEPLYNFDETAQIDICGLNTGVTRLEQPESVQIGEPYQLDYAPAGGTFEIVSGNATVTQDGMLTATNNAADIVVRYTTTGGSCDPQVVERTITADRVLPVTFSNVAAVIRKGRLQIYFTTLTEQQNDHFEIEASKDGKIFVSIGTVKSKATNGTASSPLNYEFILDETAIMSMGSLLLVGLGLLMAGRKKRLALWIAGVLIVCGILTQVSCMRHEHSSLDGQTNLFIRIKQIDIDGGYNYSKIIKVIRE